MKATDQYFFVALFIILHNVVLVFCLWMKPYSVAFVMKAIEQFSLVVLFNTMYKVVLFFTC